MYWRTSAVLYLEMAGEGWAEEAAGRNQSSISFPIMLSWLSDGLTNLGRLQAVDDG